MSETSRACVVSLDIGGQTFKLSKRSIERYPDSLLANMVEDFPALVEKGEHLFIDRSPQAFPWIQEIYRGGDYIYGAPALSPEYLQAELDFYQLPSFKELGVRVTPTRNPILDEYARELVSKIVDEIKTWGLWHRLNEVTEERESLVFDFVVYNQTVYTRSYQDYQYKYVLKSPTEKDKVMILDTSEGRGLTLNGVNFEHKEMFQIFESARFMARPSWVDGTNKYAVRDPFKPNLETSISNPTSEALFATIIDEPLLEAMNYHGAPYHLEFDVQKDERTDKNRMERLWKDVSLVGSMKLKR